jgi:hypothetical protein
MFHSCEGSYVGLRGLYAMQYWKYYQRFGETYWKKYKY